MGFTDILLIAGRVLLGGLFVVGGLTHFQHWSVIAGMMAKRVPLPQVMLGLGTGFQIVAGLALMAGFLVGWAALGLAAFTLAASWMLLDFWNQQGAERHASTNQWLTNIGVVGGLLVAAAYGF